MENGYSTNNDTVYLDNQASTPVDPRVLAAMEPFNHRNPGNPHASEHSSGWQASAAIERALEKIASAIHADADEIIFTSGATEANNLALLGLIARAPARRRRIVVSAIEHKSVLAAARPANRFGFQLEVIPVDATGAVDISSLAASLADDVLLVSIMAANNEIGSAQDLRVLADCAHCVGAVFHSDAVHAAAAGPLDLAGADVDMASFSAHKLYGPKGIGCLFIRRELQADIEPLMYGGDQQRGLRPGTLPVPLCVGFGTATALMADVDAAADRQHIAHLRDRFVQELMAFDPSIRLNGPPLAHRHPGNANLCFPGLDAQHLLSVLQPRLAAATGSACTSGNPEPSHVLRAIGLSVADAQASIRFSLGRFTTSQDIDRAIALITAALRQHGAADRAVEDVA